MTRINKYSAKRTVYNGVWYDSKAEAKFAERLDWLEKAGTVRAIQRQVPFPLMTYCGGSEVPVRYRRSGKPVRYYLDFMFQEKEGDEWVWRYVDIKGYDTKTSHLKRSIVECNKMIKIEIVS